jgi:hypothetical protein
LFIGDSGACRLVVQIQEVLTNFRSNKRPSFAGFPDKVWWFGQTGVDYIQLTFLKRIFQNLKKPPQMCDVPVFFHVSQQFSQEHLKIHNPKNFP